MFLAMTKGKLIMLCMMQEASGFPQNNIMFLCCKNSANMSHFLRPVCRFI